MRELRVLVAQIRPRKGAYAENLRRLGGILQQAAALEEPPQLIVLPETALTGYFLEGGVREHALTAPQLFRDVSAQHALSGVLPVDIVIGFTFLDSDAVTRYSASCRLAASYPSR